MMDSIDQLLPLAFRTRFFQFLAFSFLMGSVVTPAAGAGIALVQHGSVDAGVTTSTTMALAANNTAGNWIAVCIRAGALNEVLSVSDSNRNTYRQAIQFNQAADGFTFAIFYAENIGGGANTVRITDSVSGTLRVAILEYSGVATSGSLDVAGGAQGNSGTPSSGNVMTTVGGDLLVGAVMTADAEIFTGGAGYRIEESTPAEPNTKLMVEDAIQPVAGVVSASASLGEGNPWAAGLAAFKAAAGGGGGGTTLAITTTSLANGQVGVAYNASLAATGGTTPYTWSLTNGSLPAGLSLTASTGAITGTPTAAITNTPLTFQVKDSGTPQQTKSVNLSMTVTGTSNITASISPKRAGVAVTQALSLTATTNDAAGVNWTISPMAGSFSSPSSLSGVDVTLTAPSTAGAYTVTATSITDSSVTSSITIGVTDLAGVYTYHNDLARDGANLQEYALSASTVGTSTFGKLFSCTVDGAIYAQPLWVANLAIGGAPHNVVFVATMHDTLYAFDADTSPCVTLWSASLIDAAHGGTLNETSVPGSSVGSGSGDVAPEVGITGTPVIDPATGTLFVVSKSLGASFFQRLHAIDTTTGNEKAGSPTSIAATYPGTGDGSNTVTFSPGKEAQRPGLVFANGNVYISWASHEDAGPYYGWIIGYHYNGSSFTQTSVVNVTPNVQSGGIWMGGAAPAVDSNGNLYVLTGNGGFDATSPTIPNNDYGDSFLKLTTGLAISQYFTPSDQQTDQSQDKDFGSGGAAILADLPAGSPVTHLVMGGGKDHTLYVLNRDAMGGSGDSNSWQMINLGHGIFATGAFWNGNFYIAGVSGPVSMYSLNTSTAQFILASSSTPTFGFPGSTPSISSQGTSNGIVWALNNNKYCTAQSTGCGPALLRAFDATNVTTELWNSSMVAGDAAGNAVKFNVPTVANGKVYVGTRGNNAGGSDSSTAIPGELDVYGLKSN